MTRAQTAAAIFALATGILAAACNRSADPAQLAHVERMIQETGQMQAELNAMDTNALRHMQRLFEAERAGIEQRFRDTLLPGEAEVLGNYYRAMSERLPRLLEDRRRERGQLDSTAARLQNLRHDLEAGLLSRQERQRALALETQWNAALRQRLERIGGDGRQLTADRRTYRSGIDSLLRP